MKIYGEHISQDTIDRAWKSVPKRKFTCGDLELALNDLGVINTMRAADRILQKKRKAVEIHFEGGWWWFIDINEGNKHAD